jgi:hypothetical protein
MYTCEPQFLLRALRKNDDRTTWKALDDLSGTCAAPKRRALVKAGAIPSRTADGHETTPAESALQQFQYVAGIRNRKRFDGCVSPYKLSSNERSR